MHFSTLRISSLLLLCTLVLPLPVYGADVVISTDRTAQVTLNDGDALQVNAGVTLNVAGDNAVEAGGGTTISATNDGTITGGTFAFFVRSITTMTNNGTIAGNGGDGMLATGTIGTMTNTGTITGSSRGFRSGTQLMSTFTNSGTITGNGGDGVATGGTGGQITTFTNSGTITGSLSGVSTRDSVDTFTNTGTITGSGVSGVRIEYDTVAGTRFTNSGTITGHTAGMIIGGDGGVQELVNSGTIRGGTRGISRSGQLGRIDSLTNSGTIIGESGAGVRSRFITTLVNEAGGSITGSTVGVQLINNLNALGDITTLTNNGTITGQSEEGVRARTITTLTNSGTITGQTEGVEAETIERLTNSGTIEGKNGVAIRETGAGNTTLVLEDGSRIIGSINLGGGTNTLETGTGFTGVLTFTGTAPTLTSVASGSIGASSGTTIAVVDTTSQSAKGAGMAMLGGAIASSVDARMDGLRYGIAPQSGQSGFSAGRQVASPLYASPLYASGTTSDSDLSMYMQESAPAERLWEVWAQAMGSHRNQPGDDGTVDTKHNLGGLSLGADYALTTDTRVGLFGGFAVGKVQADAADQDTDMQSFYGGAYSAHEFDMVVLDATLTAGVNRYESERTVTDNTAAGGATTATADYNGYFMSPQVRATLPLELAGLRLEPSLTARYTGLWLESYEEDGAGDDFGMESRDIHQLYGRAQLAVPFEHIRDDGDAARVILRAGADVRTHLGDRTATARLVGQSVDFTPSGDDTVGGVFGGLTFEYVGTGGATVYLASELRGETDGSTQVGGTLGVRYSF